MKLIYALLLVCFPLVLFSQTDTVVIRTMKHYQEGKINLLLSPSGKKVQVQLLPKDEETVAPTATTTTADIDTLAMASVRVAARGSSVNPSLSPAQKQRIKSNECINNRFAGLSRAKPKTSITGGSAFSYTSLFNFLKTLPEDEDMEAVIDDLDAPWRDRAVQEMKNVTLNNVYMIAYAREKDNDYHLILTNAEKTLFFNVEISALPANASSGYAALKAVRQKFEQFPGSLNCGRYTRFSEPVLIRKLKGSVFFDSDHKAGTVGPQGFRPQTAWEIHPVTDIQF